MCACACVYAHAHTNTYPTTPIWNLRESVASSHWVGPRKASPLPGELTSPPSLSSEKAAIQGNFPIQ